MPRKLAPIIVAALPLLLGGSGVPVAPGATVAWHDCPSVDRVRLAAPVHALFRDRRETRALMVLAGGCVVAKGYEAGYSDANRFISWSMAKTLTAMLVGALVDDGRLRLDAPAPIAEWHAPGDPRAAITLRMMLQMRSGLAHVETGDPVERSDTNQTLFVGSVGAMAAAAIDHRLAYQPGTHFEYSTLTTLILAEIVTRTLTPSRDPHVRAAAYRAFAEARLFRPAGIANAAMEFDGAGTQIGGSLIHLTLADWARAGQLLIAGRSLAGRQVVSPAWLAFMKAPSPANPEYGGQLWLNRPGGPNPPPALFPKKGPADAVSMIGHLGQYTLASPSAAGGRGMVVVRLGHTPEGAMHAVAETLGDVLAD